MRTALSPEWDRSYDAAFADIVSRDEELLRAGFRRLSAAAGRRHDAVPRPAARPRVRPPARCPRTSRA